MPNDAQAFFTLATVLTISLQRCLLYLSPILIGSCEFRKLLPVAVMMTPSPREVKLQSQSRSRPHSLVDPWIAQGSSRRRRRYFASLTATWTGSGSEERLASRFHEPICASPRVNSP